MKIVNIAQMRQVEEACVSHGISTNELMENAGCAFAAEMENICHDVTGLRVLLLVGPGNNGGDGLVAAHYLKQAGAETTVWLFRSKSATDSNYQRLHQQNVDILLSDQNGMTFEFNEKLKAADIVVDAVFGTGHNRPLQDTYEQISRVVLQEKITRPEMMIIALDMPSGVDADTGAADTGAITADYTITLGLPKIGLFLMPAAGNAGEIRVVDIGIPENLIPEIPIKLAEEQIIKKLLPIRPKTANKGSFGKVLIIGGSPRYFGAPVLAALGALRAGAGLVTVATAQALVPVIASQVKEATYLPLPVNEDGNIGGAASAIIASELKNYDVLLAGCGIGQNSATSDFINKLIGLISNAGIRTVFDADALNILARIPEWYLKLGSEVILTPHPGEMSRLCQVSVAGIQTDRIEISRKRAKRWQKTVVLKGAYTVVAAPCGEVMINPFANPVLATAGTGDVLGGIIAGSWAQGLDTFSAAVVGTYLHGETGALLAEELGESGAIAGDLLTLLPKVIKKLKKSKIKKAG